MISAWLLIYHLYYHPPSPSSTHRRESDVQGPPLTLAISCAAAAVAAHKSAAKHFMNILHTGTGILNCNNRTNHS